MDIRAVYENVKSRIEQVDFRLLWPDFKSYNFALYNQDIVILNHQPIPMNDLFVGNTAIQYKGEFIAIWQLNEDMNIDILTSKIIHEMFHAFQMESNDCRFPNEFQAITRCHHSLDDLNRKLHEQRLIVSLIDNFNMDTFEQLLGHRLYRKINDPYTYDYESKIEVIEGMAQYVEINVLKQINQTLYDQALKRLKKRIQNPNLFFPIRIISYDVGTLLLVLMIENHLKVPYGMDSHKTILDDYLKDDLLVQASIEIDQSMFQAYEKDQEKIEKILNQTLEKQEPIIKRPMVVKAFNVYNARYYKGYLMTQYFVLLEEKELFYGDFLLDFDGRSAEKIYRIEGENLWN
jgi:hypothetical protein